MFYARESSEGDPIHKGDLVIWFSYPLIEDSKNVIVVHGESVLILETVEKINQSELVELVQDWQKWTQKFGTGTNSAILQKLLLKSYKNKSSHQKRSRMKDMWMLLRAFIGNQEMFLLTISLLAAMIATIAAMLGERGWFQWFLVVFVITGIGLMLKILTSQKNSDKTTDSS
jgi:hypothetical protein